VAPQPATPPTRQLLTRELRAAIRAEFSDLGPADLDRARVIGQGESAFALRIRDHVIRIPRDPATAAALVAEARLLAGLEARGIPFVAHDARPLHSAAGAPLGMTYRYVPGTPATGTARRGATRERLARDLGRFMGALHGVSPTAARSLGVPGTDLWRARYVPLIEECRPHLDARLARDLDRIAARLAELRGSTAPRVLIHGDISGAHTLVKPDGSLAGVVDFGEAAIGDPALDFAGVLNDRSRGFLGRVLAHYGRPVTAADLTRTECFIALAPLYEVRAGLRGGDTQALASGLARLRGRVRTAVVRCAEGP
jgi:aminoglycoside phosphotransferase (APT) family kinase protein